MNAWLVMHTDRHGVLDEHYIARLERGKIRWPNSDYRAGFAAVLGRSQAMLGFRPSSANRRPLHPLAPDQPPRDSSGLAQPNEFVSDVHRSEQVEVVAIRAMSCAFQAADRQVGGGALYGQVVRYLASEIGPNLLDVGGPGGVSLFSAASSITEIAGWMAHDCGQDCRAQLHFDQAYRLALAAGNDASMGNVCASMSHLAGQLGQSADAVRIAEAGLACARRAPGTAHLVSRLHTMRARGLAMRGDATDCRAALREADRTLDAAWGEPPADWLAEFDAASLAGEVAMCLRQLGDLVEAERQARHVIELRPGDRARSRAFGQLTLARVLVDAGRIDEAASVGWAICQIVSSLTSTRVRAGLGRLGAELAPHRRVPEVDTFFAALGAARRDNTSDRTAWPV